MNIYTTELQQLYVAFFDRPADAAGLAYWEQDRVNGTSLESIAQSFSRSSEYQSLYENKSDTEIVDAIYHNLFGRAAEQTGLSYWSGQLDSGHFDKGSITLAILTAAQGSDAATATAKTAAAQAFTSALITQEQRDAAISVARTWLTTLDGHAVTLDSAMTTLPVTVAAAVDAGLGKASISGTVVDGYISGATVFADANGNGQWDAGEAKGTTNSIGHFDLAHAKGTIIAFGGIDISTGAPMPGIFMAPVGYHQLTPISTLVQAIATEGHVGTAEAETLLKARLGISQAIDLAHFDPVAVITHESSDQAMLHSALKVQAIAAQINTVMGQVDAVLRGSGVVTDSSVGVSTTSAALAKLILQASAGVDLASANVVSETLREAAAEVGATAGQLSTIAALSGDAGQVIANLNQAIVAAAEASNGPGKQVLIELAKVQYASEEVKTILQQGAASNDLSHAKAVSSPSAIAVAVADAAYHIGDVDGDSSSDAVPLPDTTAMLDTTAPTTTIATMAFSADTGVSSTDFNTTTAAQTISGTTNANIVSGEIVEVSIDNGSTWSTASTSVGANTWSLAGVTLTASDTMKVRVTDTAGNSGTVASQAYVLDQTAPAAPGAPVLAAASDSGSSSADGITNITTGTYTGTAEAGAAVTLYDTDGTTVLGTATATGGNWSITSSALSEGAHTLTAKATDAAGNVSAASTGLGVTVDTTAPTTTIATMAFSADTGVSSTDFNTTTAAQTISGTTNANIVSGEIVEVSIDNGSTWSTASTSVGANTWSLAGVTLTASDTMKVRVTDTAGNSGTVASQAYVLDVTPVPTTHTLTAGNDTVTGTGADDIINGTVAGAFAGTDSIDGGGGNDSLNVTDSTNISTAGTTVVNVETASLTSAGTVSTVTTGWTGLNTLTVSAVGAVTMNSGATALSVTETDAGQLAADIVVDGGTTVSVASTHQGAGLITIGGTTAPAGMVTVTTSADAGQTGGAITVNGGTTVSVTQTATHAAGTTVTAESAVTVNGGASTTAVTVFQAPVVASATAVTAVTGVSAVNAVTAAPGTQPVTAVTAVTAVSAVTAVAGVAANGRVSITDSKYNTATANTISTVTLSSYGAGSFIRSNALTSLSLSGTGGTLAITNATNGAGAVPSANTTLAMTLNGLSGVSNTITDANNEITTLDVTTTGAASTLAAFADTGLTTLTVEGSQVLRLNSMNSSLTSITVSGSAGFNDGGTSAAAGFSTRGGAATFTTSSSGAISISIDSTTQSFTGSTGVDTIRISSRVDATQTITGGSSTSDELILEGGAYALTAATGAKVTGFETLGLSANVTGTVDMSNLASGFTKAHIIGNSSVALTKVPANFSLQVDKASTQVTMVYQDSTGPADTINVSLGTATSDSVNFGTLIFKDSASVGIGTVNLVSNGVDITPGDAVANFNTMVITDNGLSNLNVSGTQGLKITTLNQATSQATSFTLNNTNTGSAGVNIGVLTDTKLTSLNFAGTGTSSITTLTASTTTSLAIDNSGSKTAMVKAMTSSANLRTLNLSGNVQIGDGLVTGTGMTLTYTQGLTIDGSTDHAHVKLTLAGAGSGFVDNITLGNGNNTVTNVSTAGTVNLTLGSGANYIALGGATTNSTGRYNVTLDAGSAPDYITVGTGGTTYATTPNYVITGAQTGDRINFSADGASSANALTATTAGASTALTITAVEAAAASAHGVAYAVFGGNTYLAESASGILASTDTTLVELIGVHSFTTSTGYVTLAS